MNSSTLDVDVCVVGLGSVGSAALWNLAETTSLKVAGIEQFGVGHAYGSYAGESRVFRVAYHEGERYVPLLLSSRTAWLDLQERSGRPLFLETGTLSVAEPDNPSFVTTCETAQAFDLPCDYLSSEELVRRFPMHANAGSAHGLFDRLGGGVRSEIAVLALCELAERAGATVLQQERIVGIDEQGDRVRVRGSHGSVIHADRVIVTTGSWCAELRPELTSVVAIKPTPLTWFAPRDISLYDPARCPTFLRDQGAVHVFGVPTLDGYSVKVVGHSVDELHSPDTVAEVPARVSREALMEISAAALACFPDLHPEPIRHGMYHDGWTQTRAPIVDIDEAGRIVVVAGLSGHGFKMAPALGQLAASLAADRADSLYDPAFRLANH